MIEKDILIAGGGLIGCILLLALQKSGLKVSLIEQKNLTTIAEEDFDARSLALAPASVNILKSLNVWEDIKQFATPIETIHISELNRFGSANLEGKSDNPLGYVIEIKYLQTHLHQLLDKKNIVAPAKIINFDQQKSIVLIDSPSGQESIKAKLIVAADGADSPLRKFSQVKVFKKNYEHMALVSNIGLKRNHQNIAYERFTPSGPMALLPLTNLRASLVWSLPEKKAHFLQQASDKDFLLNLQKTFGYRLGRFNKVGRRAIFPLSQIIVKEQDFSSLIFVGNAAHTLHPVAGQGFNLGIRDVALLAECIFNHGLNKNMLNVYKNSRKHDQLVISKFTDGLVNLFSNNLFGLTRARNLGVTALDNLPVFKKIITYYAKGFSGVIPDLVCGIPLNIENSID